MKQLAALFFILFILAACNNGKDNSRSTAKKFEDPERLNTCKTFMLDLKNNNFKVALSMIDRNHTTNTEYNNDLLELQRTIMEEISAAVNKSKLAPERDWLIRMDTEYFKINQDIHIIKGMSLSEDILIPIDRGPEVIDSQIYVKISFDLTEMNPSPYTIMFAGLVHQDYLSSPTSSNIVE